MKDDVTALAKVRLEELLTFFGINTSVKVAEQDERVELRVEAPDSAKLIGHHGENLRAIQHLLNMMLRGSNHERTFVDVDVDGYKKARGEQIMTKATVTAKTVLETGQAATLEPMNPAERRLVHMAVAEIEGILTESAGEGPRRHVVIKKV